jgi:hypothetical protein
MNIRNIHYYSGIVLTLFIGLHLWNHMSSIHGAEQHIAVMEQLRPIYRSVFVEILLMLAVGVQIFSGLKLYFRARITALKGFRRLHILSGLYLAFFLVIHLSAVFAGRFILYLDTNFYFGVAGLNTFPFNLFFIPYYSLAILSFFGHIAAIHQQKMRYKLLGLTPEGQSWCILIVGLILTVAILYGLTGHFQGIDIPVEYHVLIGK